MRCHPPCPWPAVSWSILCNGVTRYLGNMRQWGRTLAYDGYDTTTTHHASRGGAGRRHAARGARRAEHAGCHDERRIAAGQASRGGAPVAHGDHHADPDRYRIPERRAAHHGRLAQRRVQRRALRQRRERDLPVERGRPARWRLGHGARVGERHGGQRDRQAGLVPAGAVANVFFPTTFGIENIDCPSAQREGP